MDCLIINQYTYKTWITSLLSMRLTSEVQRDQKWNRNHWNRDFSTLVAILLRFAMTSTTVTSPATSSSLTPASSPASYASARCPVAIIHLPDGALVAQTIRLSRAAPTTPAVGPPPAPSPTSSIARRHRLRTLVSLASSIAVAAFSGTRGATPSSSAAPAASSSSSSATATASASLSSGAVVSRRGDFSIGGVGASSIRMGGPTRVVLGARRRRKGRRSGRRSGRADRGGGGVWRRRRRRRRWR